MNDGGAPGQDAHTDPRPGVLGRRMRHGSDVGAVQTADEPGVAAVVLDAPDQHLEDIGEVVLADDGGTAEKAEARGECDDDLAGILSLLGGSPAGQRHGRLVKGGDSVLMSPAASQLGARVRQLIISVV